MEIKKVIARCLLEEANALTEVAKSLDSSLTPVLDVLIKCSGKRCFTGVGKSYLVASKIASSFSSLGYASIAIDPLRLLHGELGILGKNDIMIVVSNSGETEILVRAVKYTKQLGLSIVSIVGSECSSLAKMSDFFILVKTKEAGPFGLVPSSSTTAMMAMGDALLCGMVEKDRLSVDRFRKYHPDGHLSELMKDVK